jgi:hypothetical protein
MRAPAVFGSLPRLVYRPAERHPLVAPELRAAAPALAEDIDLLDRELLPEFHDLDERALRAQNAFRLAQLFVIVGGAAATVLGAVQAASGGGETAIGVAEALVAGVLAATVAHLRATQPQKEYFTSRLKAERLRGEYFIFLARLPPYDAEDEAERLRRLRARVDAVAAADPG